MARSDASFIHYYQTELAYYRDLAQEFGRVHPEVAYLVAGRGGDPSTDRLFQGAALLTSRLRRRVEDDLPEITHPLFARLWPQYLRPVPAVTMLQFTPLPNVLRQSQLIPAGTEVLSRALGGEEAASLQCPFRTCNAVMLHPLELQQAELVRRHAGDLQLRLRFRVTGGTQLGAITIPSLRLQLLGESATRFSLYEWLIARARQVSLQSPDGERHLTLDRSAIHAVGFEDDESLCPHLPTPLTGLRLLQEYFVFVDKFLAVEVQGLDHLERLPLTGLEVFDLVFHLGVLDPEGVRVDASNFGLSCVPAINLSGLQRADIRVSPGEHRYRIDAMDDGEVFELDRVRAYDPQRNDWIEYPRLVQERRPDASDVHPCYHVLRRADAMDGVQTLLQVTDHRGRPMTPHADVLQVSYSYTNGPVAVQLGPGEVAQPTTSSPEFATFGNITPVVPGVPIGLGRERFWRLLAKLNIHPAELCRQDGLESLIDEMEGGRVGGGPEIQAVRLSVSSRLFRRSVVPMRMIEVDLVEQSFLSSGQLFLFGTILSRMFTRSEGSMVFNQLTVRAMPSGVAHHFDPA